MLADDILKNVEYDALRVIFNKFHSVISFKPTMVTILSPEVSDSEACELVLESARPSRTHHYICRLPKKNQKLVGRLVTWILMKLKVARQNQRYCRILLSSSFLV